MRTVTPPINQPIQVMVDRSSRMPHSFTWRDRTYRISEIQECWRLIDAWWDGSGEKTYFRVECINRSVFEIMYDQAQKNWAIVRVED